MRSSHALVVSLLVFVVAMLDSGPLALDQIVVWSHHFSVCVDLIIYLVLNKQITL